MKRPRLSLLWKILLSTSVALTALFGITGWIVQNHVINTTALSLEEEVASSLQAYESLWKSRGEKLGSVSLILSQMSDVRAAFSTRDEATIRDTAGEDRKSTRLNSSHLVISYAVFCLKKKKDTTS